ncbi:hypothetical protein ACOMHN_056346 [Nucella lapillus]
MSSVIPARGHHHLNNSIFSTNRNLKAVCEQLNVGYIDNASTFTTSSGAPRLALYQNLTHPSDRGTIRLAMNLKSVWYDKGRGSSRMNDMANLRMNSHLPNDVNSRHEPHQDLPQASYASVAHPHVPPAGDFRRSHHLHSTVQDRYSSGNWAYQPQFSDNAAAYRQYRMDANPGNRPTQEYPTFQSDPHGIISNPTPRQKSADGRIRIRIMGTALSFVREATLLGGCETGLGGGGHLGPALAPEPGVDPDSERPTEAWSRLHYDNPVVWHLPDSTYGTTPTYPGPHDPFLRFVCLSDTHGVVEGRDSYYREVPDGDVLVHCGDFSMRGQPEEVARFDTFLERLPHPVKLVIAGNHELTFDERLNQSRYVRRELKLVPTCTDREVSDACKALLQHAVYLQDEHVDICGLRVYGSPWVPEYPQTSPGFSLKRGEQLLDKWRQIPATTDILVTHGPPCVETDPRHHRHPRHPRPALRSVRVVVMVVVVLLMMVMMMGMIMMVMMMVLVLNKWRQIPATTDILVTHGPPCGQSGWWWW